MKKFNWFEILLFIAVLSMSIYAAFSDPQNLSSRWFIRDDAYYYYKVAQNITEGHGSTFDGINLTNGYHPLWLWVCIPIFALARFDLILPLRILLILMGALSAGTGILLYRLLRKSLHPVIGMTAAVYWVFSIDILQRVYKQGLETGVAVFFTTLFIYKLLEYEKNWRDHGTDYKQLLQLGIYAVLVIFSRLDLVFLAGMAGIWVVFRKYPLRYLLPLDIVFVFFSVLGALIFRVTFDNYYKYKETAIYMIALSLAIKPLTAYLLGLYQKSILSTFSVTIKRLTVFVVSTSLPINAIMMVISPRLELEGFPRTLVLYDILATFLLFGSARIFLIGLNAKSTTSDDDVSPIRQFVENWKTWLTEGIAYFSVIGGALGAYMIWNKIYIGTSSPISGQIKRYWGSLPGRVYGGHAQTSLDFFGLEPFGDGSAWHPISSLLGKWAGFNNYENTTRYLVFLAIFVVLLCSLLFINKRRVKIAITHMGIIPLMSASWLQLFYYHVSGYSAYKEWYWVTELVLIVLIISILAEMILDTIKKYAAAQTLLWLVFAGITLTMSSSYWTYIHRIMPYGRTAADVPLNDIAAYLEEHTPPGSIIGMTGGGNAGYFITDRIIINMDGLINSPEYFELLKKREAGPFMADLGMDYVLSNPLLIQQLPYRKQFEPYLRYGNDRYGEKELMVFSTEP